jgi:hypothetical protein
MLPFFNNTYMYEVKYVYYRVLHPVARNIKLQMIPSFPQQLTKYFNIFFKYFCNFT